jgi:hypothetical protein
LPRRRGPFPQHVCDLSHGMWGGFHLESNQPIGKLVVTV